ncbi:MAG: Flp family type IVb pilin [Kiloniellales bacterium]
MLARIITFFKDDSGPTVIEYGLIGALVSVAAFAALMALGGSLTNMFATVDTDVSTAATSAAGAGATTP